MASNDPPSPTVTAVEHTEGTSYVVAFGDPARYPIFGSDTYTINTFPAACGWNPYQPETGQMAASNAILVDVVGENQPPYSLLMQIGNALCVAVYDALRCVPEQSRGLNFTVLVDAAESNREFKRFINWMINYNRRAGPIGIASLMTCLSVCFCRMHRDGTLQAFAKMPRPQLPRPIFTREDIYFNLSPRERTRLREYANGIRRDRRMPTILARQLIISKVDKRKLHGQLRRLVYGLFMTESDELFRVVVSFL